MSTPVLASNARKCSSLRTSLRGRSGAASSSPSSSLLASPAVGFSLNTCALT